MQHRVTAPVRGVGNALMTILSFLLPHTFTPYVIIYVITLPFPHTSFTLPGTYMAGEPLVTITAFAAQLQVISSKQRPRKLTIFGSDGAEYMFLLKVRVWEAGGTLNGQGWA